LRRLLRRRQSEPGLQLLQRLRGRDAACTARGDQRIVLLRAVGRLDLRERRRARAGHDGLRHGGRRTEGQDTNDGGKSSRCLCEVTRQRTGERTLAPGRDRASSFFLDEHSAPFDHTFRSAHAAAKVEPPISRRLAALKLTCGSL
jgi:hypothetical protein